VFPAGGHRPVLATSFPVLTAAVSRW
jgi:hypothetical protein